MNPPAPSRRRKLLALGICLLGCLQGSYGATKLTEDPNDVTINTEDIFGMPTSISIVYESDLGQAVDSSSNDKAWLSWSMSSTNGADYYTGGTLTVDSTTIFSIALTRDTNEPSAGDYTLEFDIVLTYNNDGTEFIVSNIVYTFNIHVGGAETTVDTAVGSATNGGSITAAEITENTLGDGSILSATPSVSLSQSGSNIAAGADIILEATVSGNSHTIWVIPTETIIASSDTDFDVGGGDYEWPDTTATSSVSTDTSPTKTTTVTITLKAVPIILFDLGTIYIQVPVHFRDITNDLRRVRTLRRGLQDDSSLSGSSAGGEEGSAKLFAKVTFATDNSGSVSMPSSMLASTSILATGALFLL